MKISVIGLGWYGEPLARELLKDGHKVSGTTRTKMKCLEFLRSGISAEVLDSSLIPSEEMLNSDIVILNIPPFKEELAWFKSFPWKKDAWIIFVSSVSVENKPDSESAKILKAEEDWVKDYFPTWTILRFGGLYGKERHPGKYLAGKKNIPEGDKPISLVSLEETIAATKEVIQHRVQKDTLTIIGKDRRSKREFYTEYCRLNGLPLPEFS